MYFEAELQLAIARLDHMLVLNFLAGEEHTKGAFISRYQST